MKLAHCSTLFLASLIFQATTFAKDKTSRKKLRDAASQMETATQEIAGEATEKSRVYMDKGRKLWDEGIKKGGEFLDGGVKKVFRLKDGYAPGDLDDAIKKLRKNESLNENDISYAITEGTKTDQTKKIVSFLALCQAHCRLSEQHKDCLKNYCKAQRTDIQKLEELSQSA